MHKKISLLAGLTALFTMGTAQAVCPVVQPVRLAVLENINPETGHTYEVYKADGICWADARDFVANLPPQSGQTPHLATITSSSENQWIVDKLLLPALSLPTTPLGKSQVWVGGYRDSQAQGGWRWVNNEGTFSELNDGIVYTNWATNASKVQIEPNNTDPGEENLTLGRYNGVDGDPVNPAGWNDEGSAVGSIGGFIVEFDTPRDAGECDGGLNTTEACTTVKGQTLTFPAGSFNQTVGNIKFTAFEFNDPRIDPFTGKCSVNRGPLVLFDDTLAFGSNSTLTLPEYLCGSPKFLVVKVETTGLNITKGGVLVENETDVILPGNLYQCSDPILPTPQTPGSLYSPDPQNQDVVVWQSTDPRLMFEAPSGVGSIGIGSTTAPYAGTATEATNACGSTKAVVRTGSYFVVGMHIDFNLATEYPSNSNANYASFVALTQYKLSLLRRSVDESRIYGSIKKPDWQAMSSQLKNATNKLNSGDLAGALSSMKQFVAKVNFSTYSPAVAPYVGFNFSGDHLMRGENIVFTLRVKIIPYKPVP